MIVVERHSNTVLHGGKMSLKTLVNNRRNIILVQHGHNREYLHGACGSFLPPHDTEEKYSHDRDTVENTYMVSAVLVSLHMTQKRSSDMTVIQ